MFCIQKEIIALISTLKYAIIIKCYGICAYTNSNAFNSNYQNEISVWNFNYFQWNKRVKLNE